MKIFFFLLGIVHCKANFFIDLPWEDYLLIPVASLVLAMIAGIMSGLTVGLLSIDELKLKLKLQLGSQLEKKYATRIMPILKDHHLLLVTLLISNAIALEILPLVLDLMVGGVFAIIFSVFLTVFIAEIIPQALCIGIYQIPIASAFAKIVQILIYVLFPITYPIARLLDKIIGKNEEKKFSDTELKQFFSLQINKVLNSKQIRLIQKTIDYKHVKIQEICVDISKVFYLEQDFTLTEDVFEEILEKGYGRVPVMGKEKWIGVLITKDLINAEIGANVKNFNLKEALFVSHDTNLLQALHILNQGVCRLAFVKNEFNSVIGIVTLHDIFQYIIKDERISEHSSIEESTIEEKGKEGFWKKIYYKIKGKKTIFDKPLVEFKLVEKDSMNLRMDTL